MAALSQSVNQQNVAKPASAWSAANANAIPLKILPKHANIDCVYLVSMTAPTSEIFTIAEVATYLKVAERTLYRLVAAKKIPSFKVGGAWRFRKIDIDAWIASQTDAEASKL